MKLISRIGIKGMMSNGSRIIGYGRNGGYGERLPLLPLLHVLKVGKESAIYILFDLPACDERAPSSDGTKVLR